MKKRKLKLSDLKAEVQRMDRQRNYRELLPETHRKSEQELCELLKMMWSDLPQSPYRDYWTNADMDVAAIKAKYGLKRWKSEPLALTIECERCGQQEVVTFKTKRDITAWKCPNKACPHNAVRLPFGKFRGLTVADVYREQPSYLAWFLDAVESDSAEVRAIKAEIRKLPDMKQHLEKYRSKQLQQQWAGQSRFSSVAIDDLCDRLFNGE